MKSSIHDVIIEITRKCNMACSHCLRGDAENVTININHIEKLFSQVSYISTLTITGGEPSLHPEIIMDIVRIAKEMEVEIGNFYMVTNAKRISDDFIVAIAKLWAYCTDNECSSVAVSGDVYHNDDTYIESHNIDILKGFSFFSWKDEMGAEYNDNIINEGRGVDNFASTREVNFYPFDVDVYEDTSTISESMLYLNCEGKLLGACDLSYDSQRAEQLIIADVQAKEFNLLESIEVYNSGFDDCHSKSKPEMLELEYA